MSQKLQPDAILEALRALGADGANGVSSSEIHAHVGGSYATVGRLLDKRVQAHALVRTGKARATRYFLPPAEADVRVTVSVTDCMTATVSPVWSDKAQSLLNALNRPLGARTPVTYQRRFLDEYVPNESTLLPRELADALAQEGRMQVQKPRGRMHGRSLNSS